MSIGFNKRIKSNERNMLTTETLRKKKSLVIEFRVIWLLDEQQEDLGGIRFCVRRQEAEFLNIIVTMN